MNLGSNFRLGYFSISSEQWSIISFSSIFIFVFFKLSEDKLFFNRWCLLFLYFLPFHTRSSTTIEGILMRASLIWIYMGWNIIVITYFSKSQNISRKCPIFRRKSMPESMYSVWSSLKLNCVFELSLKTHFTHNMIHRKWQWTRWPTYVHESR